MRNYKKILLINFLLPLSFFIYLYAIISIESLLVERNLSFWKTLWLPIYLMPPLGVFIIFKITKKIYSLRKKLVAGLLSFIFLSIACLTELVWYSGYKSNNGFSEYVATLELVNQSRNSIELIRVSINNQEQEVNNLNIGEKTVIKFNINPLTDEQYLFKVRFSSGETLQLKEGYIVYGMDFEQQATILNERIIVKYLN